MQPFDSIPRLEGLTVLDPLAAKIVKTVRTVYRPRFVRDALHGVWLGHPLHPVLVQVPVGAWTSVAVLDLVPDRYAQPGLRGASTALVATGLAGAVPAIAAGWNDWAESHEQQQRVGLVHAAANYVGTVLYAASLLDRLRGRAGRGRVLAYTGYGANVLGALLGGHLSYRQALGANHTEELPHVVAGGWHDVIADADVTATPQRVLLDATPLVVVRDGAGVHALADRCSHLSAPLHQGTVADGCVTCPWHQSVFRLSDGGVVHGPATSPQPVFQVRVDAGRVLVRLPGADG